jgi:hypothetical protein
VRGAGEGSEEVVGSGLAPPIHADAPSGAVAGGERAGERSREVHEVHVASSGEAAGEGEGSPPRGERARPGGQTGFSPPRKKSGRGVCSFRAYGTCVGSGQLRTCRNPCCNGKFHHRCQAGVMNTMGLDESTWEYKCGKCINNSLQV